MNRMRSQQEIIRDIRRRHDLGDGDPVDVKSLQAKVDMGDSDPHRFTARITAATLDRDKEVLLPSGMIATEFEKIGAGFWNHDYDRPVLIPDGQPEQKGNVIVAKGRFMKRPDDFVGDFFPDFVRAFVTQMAKAGRAAGVSIGFIPVESRRPSKKDLETFGSDLKVVFTKWKLLEFSIAPVPANPEAYVMAVGKRIGRKGLRLLFPEADVPDLRVEPDPAEIRRARMLMRAKASASRIVAESKRLQKERRRREMTEEVIAKLQGRVYL